MEAFQFEIIAGLVALVGLVVFFLALKMLLGSSWFWGWLTGNIGLIFIASSVALLVSVLDIRSYKPMQEGIPVATFSVHVLAPNQNQLRLVSEKGLEERFTFSGSHYYFIANQFIWSPQIRGMGVNHGYRLSHLIGESNRGAPEKVVLGQSSYVDLWQLVQQYLAGGNAGMITAIRGQTSQMAVVDGGMYELMPETNDLKVKPLNKIAKQQSDLEALSSVSQSETSETVEHLEEGIAIPPTEYADTEASQPITDSESAPVESIEAEMTLAEESQANEPVQGGVEGKSAPATESSDKVTVTPADQSNSGKIDRKPPGEHLKATPVEIIQPAP